MRMELLWIFSFFMAGFLVCVEKDELSEKKLGG